MDTPPVASGPDFKICPLCEEGKLVFLGLNEARCPACEYEPSEDFLKTLRQIVTLPETTESFHSRTNGSSEPESRAS